MWKPETGSYVYHCDAISFHEWEFRTQLHVRGTRDEFFAEAVGRVVDGLRGDALVVAQVIGFDDIWNPGVIDGERGVYAFLSGVETLAQAMKRAAFPLVTHEAKELFRQCCKPSGVKIVVPANP